MPVISRSWLSYPRQARRNPRWEQAVLGLARGLMILAALRMLSGCGSAGGTADAPTDLKATAGDGLVTLTWTAAPNVEYWIFYAPASSITADTWAGTPGVLVLKGVGSPATIGGLTNGTTYAFALNGRTDGGPGGPFTPSVSAVPRLAGSAGTWTVGAAIGASDLNAETYGAAGGNLFIAVGAGGKIASSKDGIAWTTLGNTGTSADLNAIAFGGSSYAAAGAGGVILYSTDGSAWTAEASATSNALYGMASNGAGAFVGVGANGTIVYSSNGISWNAAASGTNKDLLAVTYGIGGYMAVGAGGTLLNSVDGINWTAKTSNTALDLRSVAYGTDSATGGVVLVAVGASGAVVASADGITWTSQASLPVGSINGITYGRQFVLVGDSGIIYTSQNGTAWAAQPSGTGNNLKAIANNLVSYSAVGAAGTNVLAK